MTDVICGKCPDVYKPSDIVAVYGDESTTLEELSQRAQKQPRQGWRRKSRPETSSTGSTFRPTNLGSLESIKNWTFLCPKDHVVDANAGPALAVAVLGESGSSKTHFLPAMVYELRDLNRLRPVGVRLRPATYGNPELERNKDLLYVQGAELPRTPRGSLEGPFGYKLVVRPSGQEQVDLEYVLQLFDVAGENLASVVEIAANAKFIYLCRGLIVLLDPVGVVPTAFDEGGVNPQVLIRNQTNVRNSIGTLADALEMVWHQPVASLGIPIVFVVSKADSIDWGFDYKAEIESVFQEYREGRALREALEESSVRTRDAYARVGAARILEEVEDRFPHRFVRFVAASATSEMPKSTPSDGRVWLDAEPNGVALAVCHILDMLDALS